MERKTGENFDDKTAEDLFDKLRNVEGKVKPKKEDSKLSNISNLMSEAQYLENKGKLDEAIDLYNQVIFTLPDSSKAYWALDRIYQKQGDIDSEKEILKKAISNCSKNEDFKKRLGEL
ncbi:tetratricopeptide repeat protein [Methanobrevibacter sp.]|uniref:tetratricopeptide repeat protein n=1 Tax=Methanobrevibacter sp. TaxID=66852 RepID=UPI00386A534E